MFLPVRANDRNLHQDILPDAGNFAKEEDSEDASRDAKSGSNLAAVSKA